VGSNRPSYVSYLVDTRQSKRLIGTAEQNIAILISGRDSQRITEARIAAYANRNNYEAIGRSSDNEIGIRKQVDPAHRSYAINIQ
jgi:hypothetical protein